MTVVLLYSNMVIDVGTDGYRIRLVGVTRQRNRRKRISNGNSVVGKPNKKQSTVQYNTYTQSKGIGTFNIRYNMIGLVLV